MPLHELQERQLLKLKRLLIHAYETVDYYKEVFTDASFNPYRIKSVQELSNIQLLTKKEIINYPERLISKRYDPGHLVKSCTGGSTGTQLHFCIDRKSVHEKNACAWRHNRWANWDLGTPVAAIWGNPPTANSIKKFLRQKLLSRFTYLDTMNMTEETMNNFAIKINMMNKYVLYGHAHSIFIFSEFLKKNKIDVFSPEGIVATSMMLMENERSVIEQTFKTNVTNRYGCEEVNLIGSECGMHKGMHLNIDHLVIEFIKADGSHASPGEEGRIVLTDLTNYGMPFIRYEVGDVGVPSDGKCTCGRGLPMMEKLVGRTADFLIRRDDSLVAGVSLIERLLTKIPGIYQMQIVQNNRDSLLLRIVKGHDFSESTSTTMLREEFDKIFPGLSLYLDFIENIPQESSGKYRFSICNITPKEQ